MAPEETTATGSDKPIDRPVGIEPTPPWEEIGVHGPLTAFFSTALRVLRAPGLFFDGLQADRSPASAIWFWFLAVIPPAVISGIQADALMTRLPEMANMDPSAIPFRPGWAVFVLLLPVLQFLSMVLVVLAVHFFLHLMRADAGGLRGSLRAAGYAAAPGPLGFVPLIGAPVSALWMGILQYMGLRRVHRTTHRRMFAAYLLPALFAMVLVTLAGLAALKWLRPSLEALFGF